MHRVITILLLLLCSVPFLYPLHKDGLFNAHDSESNLLRAAELYNNLNGLTYVRWFKNFSGGYGYPFLNFYAPLTYYIMVIIKLTGISWITTAKIFLILITILRGYGMYRFCRNFFPRKGAILGTIGYIYVPYYICDIYVRGDFSEALGFSLIPLVLHLFYRLIKTGKSIYILGSTLTLASIILSHNGIALMFIPLLLFFILWFAGFKKIFKPMFCTLLGIGISSIFWLPSLIEKKYVHIERTIEGKFQYHNNFIGWKELLSSHWGFGTSPNDPMPLGLGWIHISIFIIALIYLFIPRQKIKSSIIFFIITTLSAIFLMFPISNPIWKNLPLIKFLQFPWRLLAITSFSTSVLFAALPSSKKWIFLIGIIAILFYSQYCIANGQIQIPDSELTQRAIRLKEITTAYSDEYRPLWAKKHMEPNPPEMNTFWFPGWIALVDGNVVPIKIQNPTGLIQIDVPGGSHSVELRFTDTPIRRMAKLISGLSMAILLLVIVPFKKRFFFWLLVSGFWFLSPESLIHGDSVLYITETHNTESFYIESKQKKDIFIISPHELSNIGLFIINSSNEIETRWLPCGKPLYNVNYFYELQIKSGNSPIFIYLTTDPYKLALLCMEKGAYDKAIPLLLQTEPSIEQKLCLAVSYYYSGEKEMAKELFNKIENISEEKKSIDDKNYIITLTPWDMLLGTGTLIHDGAFYNKNCHKPGQLIYGPYSRFPRGAYNVTYWIMASDYNLNDIVATIDVFSEGYPIKEMSIKGIEFQEQDRFYPFTINFYNPDSTKGLEFRVTTTGTANIVVKQIDIKPDIYNTTRQIQKDLHLSWGRIHLDIGNLAKAYEKLLMAVKQCPFDIEANLLLADTLYKMERHKDASIIYEKILELVPNHEKSLFRLNAQRISELTPENKMLANFGNIIEFKGYTMETINGKLKISYYWKILSTECRTYMVYVHFRYNNKIIFQNDHYLVEYNPSLIKWIPGEIIKEEYVIENIPKGDYKIIIGLWKPPDQSSRIKATSGESEIVVGEIKVNIL